MGPIGALRGGAPVRVGSGRERFVLATLLLNADRVTSAGYLVDALWPDPPRSAKAQLHNMISNLRRRLRDGTANAGGELIVSRPLGYELRLGAHRLDLSDFRRLVRAGRQAAADGDQTLAAAMFAEALALWRGPALADIADDHAAATAARHALEEERLAALESQLDAWLELGRLDDLLEENLEAYPFRERLWQMRMAALARAGRRADALEAFGQARRRLVDELGVEPGPQLRALQQQILHGEPIGPLRTVPLLPRQLPPATAPPAGRDKLIGEIGAGLARPEPLVLLVGPGGIGKTTLALGAAHRAVASYPDGQLYADLRGSTPDPADPHDVAARFLRALGVDGSLIPDDPQERLALYRSSLAGTRTLVVLDDAAGEEQVRPLLPGDTGCCTLVTSRRRLGGLVTPARWTVPVLDPADAAELIARVVGPHRAAAEPDAVIAIAALCGWLPLAVCVAAARLAVRPDWTLTEFAATLARERTRLDELAIGDLDVRAGIAVSYEALPPELRILLRRLALASAPDWPAWVAGELAATPAAEPLLDRLIDVHLVEPLGHDILGQRRYRLHDLIADFARERLREEEPAPSLAAALTRLLTGWLALAAEADEGAGHGMLPSSGLPTARPTPPAAQTDAPDARADAPAARVDASAAPTLVPAARADAPWARADVAAARAVVPAEVRAVREAPRAWLEAERAGLVAAVGQACAAALGENAAVGRAGMVALGENAAVGRAGAVALGENAAVGQAGAAALGEIAGGLALRLSGFLSMRGYYDEWERTLRAAVEVVREHGPSDMHGRLLAALFAAALRRSRHAELPAIAAAELELARRMGDAQREIGALVNAGWAARVRGRLAEAQAVLEQALSLCDGQTPTRLRTRALNGLALVHREAGRYERALPLVREALEIERAQGIARITAICLINCAGALVDLGRFEEAERALAEARTITGDPADDLRATDIDLTLADIDLGRGRWQAGRQRLRRALAFAESQRDLVFTAELLRALGDLAIGRDEPGEAVPGLERALAIWRRLDVPLETARIHARLERAHLARGDTAAAAAHRDGYRTILSTLDLDEACLRLT